MSDVKCMLDLTSPLAWMRAHLSVHNLHSHSHVTFKSLINELVTLEPKSNPNPNFNLNPCPTSSFT